MLRWTVRRLPLLEDPASLKARQRVRAWAPGGADEDGGDDVAQPVSGGFRFR